MVEKAYVTSYRIQGFRSLRNFNIEILRGLNVLVGPNGSGKTNFIEFLDFLSNVITHSASTAVSKAGGVSRVFSQEDSKKSHPSIKAKVSGVADVSPFVRGGDAKLNIFNFDYEIEIKFSTKYSIIFISSEKIRFRKLRTDSEIDLAMMNVGSLEITRNSRGIDDYPKFDIADRLLSRHVRNPLSVEHPFSKDGDISKERITRQIFAGVDESILSSRNYFPAIEAVKLAITRGRSFNLVPEKVRMPDDLTRPPSISPEGFGLTSTLFHLQKAAMAQKPRVAERVMRVRRLNPEHFSGIVEWTKLVFPELKNINIIPDPHTGKYIGYLEIGDSGLKLPFSSASDGTLKWLALITLVITRGGVYSIEEPENFLHPKMQQYLIDLVRDFSADGDEGGYFIISSHSETIINKCNPEEIILFNFGCNGTECARLRNVESVKEQINETGFGLGYYYANNAVY